MFPVNQVNIGEPLARLWQRVSGARVHPKGESSLPTLLPTRCTQSCRLLSSIAFLTLSRSDPRGPQSISGHLNHSTKYFTSKAIGITCNSGSSIPYSSEQNSKKRLLCNNCFLVIFSYSQLASCLLQELLQHQRPYFEVLR